MKQYFKKIATVLGSALMVGATMGVAAAAAYPVPFVQGGAANVAIIYGTNNAATSDIIGASDIASNLATRLAAQTASGSVTSSATASGGDSVNMASSSQKLFYSSAISAAKSSITGAEMPTLLKDGTFSDDSGTSYTYTQSISVGNRTVTYGTSSSDLSDPIIHLDGNTDTSSPLYTYKMTLNKNLNITHADTQGNDIEVFGEKFTIGANSNSAAGTPILYLYGSGTSVTLNEGEEKTITVSGTDHTVKLVGVDSTGKASISVDGGSIREISEGSASKLSGLELYIKNSFYSAKESSQNYAVLNIGGEILKLQHNSNVYKGSDETSVQNTKVTLGISGGLLSSIQIAVAMQSSSADYIKAGESFSDPVFGGLKVSLASVTPALDATTREKVVVDTDNSKDVRVTFTADTSAGTEKANFVFVHDQDDSESTVTPRLADQSNNTIHVVEGESVKEKEYMVINSGDYGRIIKATDLPDGSLDSNSKIYFEDALTGTQVFDSGLTVGINGYATTNLNGQPYYFNVTNASASTVKIY